MDLKGYVLLGGGLLLISVFLHAIYTLRRVNRPASDTDEAALGREDSDVDAEAWNALLRSDQAEQELTGGSVSMEQPDSPARPEILPAADGTKVPVDPEPVADETQHRQATPEEADRRPDNGSRVVNGRQRREPRVPRPMRAGLHRRAKPLPPRSARRGGDEAVDLQDVIAIWVCAEPDREMQGDRLLAELSACGLLFYSDRLFRKTDTARGGDWYTVANGVEPGTFDMSEPAALATPRIAMLLRLGTVRDPAAAFEDMLDVAGRIAESFGACLKDERYSDMGVQTVEHCRQRIREYRRTHLRA